MRRSGFARGRHPLSPPNSGEGPKRLRLACSARLQRRTTAGKVGLYAALSLRAVLHPIAFPLSPSHRRVLLETSLSCCVARRVIVMMALLEASSAISSSHSPPRVEARTFSHSLLNLSENTASGLSSPTCSSSSSSQPSLYVAFKVLTLVNAFRERVKKHSQVRRKVRPRKVAEDFVQDFERQAFDEVDRYLGRKSKGSKALRRKQCDVKAPSVKGRFTWHDRSCQKGIER